jgi:hypothetical protein
MLRAPQHSHPFAYGSICLHMGASVCKWDLAGYIFPGFKKKCPIYKRDRVPFANGRVPFTNGSHMQTGGNSVASMYDHRKSVHVPETDFNLFRAGGSASRQIEICIFNLLSYSFGGSLLKPGSP